MTCPIHRQWAPAEPHMPSELYIRAERAKRMLGAPLKSRGCHIPLTPVPCVYRSRFRLWHVAVAAVVAVGLAVAW